MHTIGKEWEDEPIVITSYSIHYTKLYDIAIILKKGFNEVIRGMESLDERLKQIEEKLEK